ncbi:TIGR03943 family putative permease subunit [Brevibacillus parabrevis]|uniref:TIGR03943 family putative permease subunit n=1 Tax=Brevibacillus parabrevis TaxID=54914 RepID=UPI001C227F73|nr:TIGR03943 family protein [Brevibacillus parabrevis]MBU8711798.1 TIGR03943 family protein [Brevibacillus parabrevis]MED2257863.1 TIGR03943 family protein [Brevibacillus parabrevis]WDV97345.1 TIGR03943 family protein [Brevibacillus parabrevis]
MQKSNRSGHDWMRSLILAGFTGLLSYLIWTDKLGHYLAPKLHMLSYVTLGILVILTFVSVRQLVAGRHHAYDCDCEDAHHVPRTRWGSVLIYGLFLLPIFMGFFMPDKILGSAIAEKRGVTLLSNDVRKLSEVASGEQAQKAKQATSSQGEEGQAVAPASLAPGEEGQAAAPASSVAAQEGQAAALASSATAQEGQAAASESQAAGEEGQAAASASPAAGQEGQAAASASTATGQEAQAPASTPIKPGMSDAELKNHFSNGGFGDFYTDIATSMYKQPVIKLNDKIFLDGLTTLELYAQDFAGKELETLGFVYKEPGFASNQFVVARFSVTCCTADASVFGVLVESESASKWAKDSWVQVRGKLELRKVDGFDMLVLKAAHIQPVQAPKDPYVYYSYEAPSN